MQLVLVLIAPPRARALDDSMVSAAIEAARAAGAEVGARRWLAEHEAVELAVDGDPVRLRAIADQLRSGHAIDVALVPAENRRKRLLIADMDSTMIENETLDELAEEAGIGARVAEITARSMRGEIDFAAALRERVAMLAGLDIGALDRTAARIRVTPGAATLVRTMRSAGVFTALVSGGFKFCTGPVRALLGFDVDEANDLVIADRKLTGALVEPVLDRDAKRTALERFAAARGITPADCLAVGDGANDMAMLARAGLGVAYRGKPIVAAAAAALLDHADLTGLLYLQGYTKAEFA